MGSNITSITNIVVDLKFISSLNCSCPSSIMASSYFLSNASGVIHKQAMGNPLFQCDKHIQIFSRRLQSVNDTLSKFNVQKIHQSYANHFQSDAINRF